MTLAEFLPWMAYISTAIQKPLSEEAATVYFDLLGDLPVEVLKAAAKRVCLEHKWSSFPNPAEIREAAAKVARGPAGELSPAEAWAKAWHEINSRIDPELEYTIERARKSLPPLVWEAIRAMGIPALCYGNEPVSVFRAQFTKIYEQLQARDHRDALLPPDARQAIPEKPVPRNLPASIADAMKTIGRMDE